MTRSLVMVCAMAMGCVVMADQPTPSPFKITTKRDTDRVDVDVKSGKAEISIRSPFGISQANIVRVGKSWPEVVTLKLHLKGLEKFSVSNGNVTIHAAVSSSDPASRVRVWKDNAENVPVDDESPYWLDLRMIGSDGKPTKSIPLQEGYFEIRLPKPLFEGNPASISVDWIDFYRN
ncbi:MAG: hypothetical protein U0941_21745 [Planctomycetaceae bacterium]